MKAILCDYTTTDPIAIFSHCCFVNCSGSKGFFFIDKNHLMGKKQEELFMSPQIEFQHSQIVFFQGTLL
jgi:hypothetical protein